MTPGLLRIVGHAPLTDREIAERVESQIQIRESFRARIANCGGYETINLRGGEIVTPVVAVSIDVGDVDFVEESCRVLKGLKLVRGLAVPWRAVLVAFELPGPHVLAIYDVEEDW